MQPPSAPEVELDVLTTALTLPDECESIFSRLSPDDFYKTTHKILFAILADHFRRDKAVDLSIITTTFTADQKEHLPSFISNLLDGPPCVDTNHSIQVLLEMTARRRIGEFSNATAKAAADLGRPLSEIGGLVCRMQDAVCLPSFEKQARLRPAVLESEKFISNQMPEKRVFLHPWLMAMSIILITGARGIGKSWFLIALLVAIVKCKSFGPWDTVLSVPCLYLDGEMAAQDAQERLMAMDQSGEKQSPLYIYSDAYASSQGLPRANLLDPEWRAAMKDLLLELGVKVWAVDNIASLTPGIDENSKQEWDPINQWLLELRFNEITTILAHHTNRGGGQRGTSGREDNIDISILLKQPEGYTAEDGASFIASFTKARIAIPHLSKIADTAFQMRQDANGKTVWTWGAVKQQRNQQIIALHLEGVSNNDIAKELGCTKQNVGQVIRRNENCQK